MASFLMEILAWYYRVGPLLSRNEYHSSVHGSHEIEMATDIRECGINHFHPGIQVKVYFAISLASLSCVEETPQRLHEAQ